MLMSMNFNGCVKAHESIDGETMTQKLQLYLSDDAAEIIRQSTTERKRGEWLSNVVLEYSRIVTGLPAQSADDGLLERIDSRLANVERQLAVLIKKAV
jgi:hypothetical protein